MQQCPACPESLDHLLGLPLQVSALRSEFCRSLLQDSNPFFQVFEFPFFMDKPFLHLIGGATGKNAPLRNHVASARDEAQRRMQPGQINGLLDAVHQHDIV